MQFGAPAVSTTGVVVARKRGGERGGGAAAAAAAAAGVVECSTSTTSTPTMTSTASSGLSGNVTTALSSFGSGRRRSPPATVVCVLLLLLFLLSTTLLLLLVLLFVVRLSHSNVEVSPIQPSKGQQQPQQPSKDLVWKENDNCAILFFGLPRAYETVVLPSIEQHIIRPNAQYDCDYYIHYYYMKQEQAGRSGTGGTINPEAIRQLQQKVWDNADRSNPPPGRSSRRPRRPIVAFAMDTEESFIKKYQSLLDKIHTTKTKDGQYKYFPWKAKTYQLPETTTNIIKMWHSIQSVWELMEQQQHHPTGITPQQSTKGKTSSSSSPASVSTPYYTRVAVLRSDVFYMTPIDVYEQLPPPLPASPVTSAATTTTTTIRKGATPNNNGTSALVHNTVIIPGFGRYPVNDRMIVGPYPAVKVWASQRFARLEQHISWILQHDPGWGLHEERFINYTILSHIRNKLGYTVREHPTMCFFRARPDESIWITDCHAEALPSIIANLGGGGGGTSSNSNSIRYIQQTVARILGRPCGKINKIRHKVAALNCSS